MADYFEVDVAFEDKKDNVYPEGEFCGTILVPSAEEITFLQLIYPDGKLVRFQAFN